jgi:hypothetical protein
MFNMTAEISQEDIKNLLQNFSKDLVRKAIRSALDRTGTWAKNYLATDISSNYNLSASKVKKAINVSRTTQSSLEMSVSIKGTQLSILNDFGAIQDRTGIRASISRTAAFSVPHAFINIARRGSGRFIAIRAGRSRYPTSGKPGRGPSLPMLVNRSANREKRDADLTNHLYQELEEQIAKRTAGLPAPAALE